MKRGGGLAKKLKKNRFEKLDSLTIFYCLSFSRSLPCPVSLGGSSPSSDSLARLSLFLSLSGTRGKALEERKREWFGSGNKTSSTTWNRVSVFLFIVSQSYAKHHGRGLHEQLAVGIVRAAQYRLCLWDRLREQGMERKGSREGTREDSLSFKTPGSDDADRRRCWKERL